MKVTIGKDKLIYDYIEEEVLKIKEDLTLENPAYKQALRFSKWGKTKIPKHLFYYTQLKNAIIVPRGYNIPFEHSIEEDNRIECTVDYPNFKLSLRDTQRDAVNHYLEDTDKGLIVLPTGKGKSILGLHLAHLLKQRTLVIVHKDDLVDGWTQDSKICFGEDFKVGIFKAKRREVGDQITIATIQTLNRISSEQLEEFQKNFGMVIIDECHHISSSSFDLLHKFSACYKVGLSATPERSDGLTDVMYYHLGDCAFKYEADHTDKDILPVHVKARTMNIEVPIYLVKKDRKWELAEDTDLNPKGSHKPILKLVQDVPFEQRPRIPYFHTDNEVLTNSIYYNQICKDIISEYKMGRSCVCFFSQKKHIDYYKELLVARGVPEDQVLLYYGDAKESKEEMKKKAESRQSLITLATYSIATEGTNVKAWEVCFLVSSINNEKNTEQAVGRCRRSGEGKLSKAIVYDYILPNVYSIGSKHFYTRNKRYKKLGFEITRINDSGQVRNVAVQPQKKSMFTRGF